MASAGAVRSGCLYCSVLELRDTHKRFGSVEVLRGMSLRVKPGETVALIGPSGCGKSTALRLLAGLLEPTAGGVLIHHEPLRRATLLETRRKLGYVIQDGGLFPHLTARENATLLLRDLGRSRAEAQRRLDELCPLLHVSDEMLDAYPGRLSGGQRQRVALLRALVHDPDGLLLDEPLAALDPVTRGELQRELKALFAQLQKAALLVTHDLAEAAYLADRVVLMHAGVVEQEGSPMDLIQRPATEFASSFVGAQLDRVGALVDASRDRAAASQAGGPA